MVRLRAAAPLWPLLLLACSREELPRSADTPVVVPPPSVPPTPMTSSAPPLPAYETLLSSPGDELFPRSTAAGELVFSRESLRGDASDAALFALASAAPGVPRTERRLTREGKFASSPALSRDGADLVYLSNTLGPLALLRTTVAGDGSTSVIVSSDRAREPNEPAISPDGTIIAFSFANAEGVRTIATIGVDGSKLTPLFAGRAPSFRPDGRALIYVAPSEGHNHLFVAELPGAESSSVAAPQPLTRGAFDCDHPSYSPDGRRIVFSSNRGYSERGAPRETYLRVFTMNADGSSITPVTPEDARAATPSWGPDGRIYFAISRGEGFDLARARP